MLGKSTQLLTKKVDICVLIQKGWFFFQDQYLIEKRKTAEQL